MWSSLETVTAWAGRTLEMPASTYPLAESTFPFVVVNRTGGECDYPHDYPRYAIQIWADTDSDGESYAFDTALALPSIVDESERINAVGAPEIVQLGFIDGGGFVWQVSFDLATNIYQS